MMDLLITVAVMAVYLGRWLFTASFGSRWLALLPKPARCHGEGRTGYVWRQRRDCRQYCGRECWRRPTSVEITGMLFAKACAVAVIWPLAFLPAIAWHLATRQKRGQFSAQRIAELERELGMSA